ncbi:small ribosomal subunit protein bS18m [Lepeophtheirus salmonis]|uniref:28S ribosomal protein S18c, mitochondriallike [Musca domestica] n=1 Tax=Lepeophtheirus salmonis TaxID=72036 RepID=A0A0K2UGH9_LEPSM|nr:28S ribosomal protein S18c, mitochondrial-like [Lepeophtheirus salmonis]
MGLLPGVLIGTTRRLCTSSILMGNARKGKRLRRSNPIKDARMKLGPSWKADPLEMKSPLFNTPHPVQRFTSQSISVSNEDEPLECIDDPYKKESTMCILCPRRYAISIRPDYKNPKLLAQFISPHTGLVYKSHITGLCKSMQDELENEVKRAQDLGYMSTQMKEVHYLKDPVLVDPTKPIKKNPF